jgi:hypothetical protein
LSRGVVDDRAATERYDACVSRKLRERPPLERAKRAFSSFREDIRDRLAGQSLYTVIEVDRARVKPLRYGLRHRRLARSHRSGKIHAHA